MPSEVLEKMHAPGQTDAIPFITAEIMEGYDAFLFGIPTRYGNYPAQWKAFMDSTGKQWQTGAFCKYMQDLVLLVPCCPQLAKIGAQFEVVMLTLNSLDGKYAGVFVSTATAGGGQESTVMATMSTFAHHGMIYVPLYVYFRAFFVCCFDELLHDPSFTRDCNYCVPVLKDSMFPLRGLCQKDGRRIRVYADCCTSSRQTKLLSLRVLSSCMEPVYLNECQTLGTQSLHA